MFTKLPFDCIELILRKLSNSDLRNLRLTCKRAKSVVDEILKKRCDRLTLSRDTPADIVESFSSLYPLVKCISLKNGKKTATYSSTLLNLLKQVSRFSNVQTLSAWNNEDCSSFNVHLIGSMFPSLEGLMFYTLRLTDSSIMKLLSSLSALNTLSLTHVGALDGTWLSYLPNTIRSLTWIGDMTGSKYLKLKIPLGAQISLNYLNVFLINTADNVLRDLLHHFPNIQCLHVRLNKEKNFSSLKLERLQKLTRLVLTVENLRQGFFWGGPPLKSVKEVALRLHRETYNLEMINALGKFPNASTIFINHDSRYIRNLSMTLRSIAQTEVIEKIALRLTAPFVAKRQWNVPTTQSDTVCFTERDPFCLFWTTQVYKWRFKENAKEIIVYANSFAEIAKFSTIHFSNTNKLNNVAVTLV